MTTKNYSKSEVLASITGHIDADEEFFRNEKATGTVTCASVAGAEEASGTVQVVNPVANTFATGTVTLASAVPNTFATGTVTCAAVEAGDTVTINGLVYTAVSGAKADNTEFSIDTGNNECAADLEDSIDNDVRAGTTGDISASVASAVVTVTTDVLGAAGNAITLVSSTGVRLAVSGAGTLTDGVTADTVTANGLVYTAVAGAKADDTEFSIDTSNDAAATDLAASITADTRSGTSGDLSATATTVTVTMTTTVTGTGGNAITLISSNGTRLAVSGSGTLTGGVTADTVTVNGLVYTAVTGAKADDTEFSIDTSNDACATDLADSIDDDTRTGTLNDVTAVASTDTVTITQTVRGAGGNATTLTSSSTGVRLVTSGATFTGGVTGDTVTLNGLVYTAVVGAKADDTEFSTDTSDDACATDLADSIDDDVRVGTILDVSATATTDVVTIEETIGGTPGNAITLVSSNGTRLAVSGATLTGGTTPTDNMDFSVTTAEKTPVYCKLLIHAAEAVTLKIAYDGTTYVTIGAALTANVPTEILIPVDSGDILNFQTATAGGVTLRKCKVIAIYNPTS
jgi:hypothetical protein